MKEELKDLKFSNDSDVNELRKERDLYNEKANEIQDKIDKLILKKIKCDTLVGKYYYINTYYEGDVGVYIKIDSVERLFNGIKITGEAFNARNNNDDIFFSYDQHYSISLNKNELDMNVMLEIYEEKYYTELNKLLDKIRNVSKIDLCNVQ